MNNKFRKSTINLKKHKRKIKTQTRNKVPKTLRNEEEETIRTQGTVNRKIKK